METLLQLRGIEKRFGPRLLYKDADLDVYPGITVLTGANGTGKSTLLKIMAGLLSPDAGTVTRSCGDERTGYLGHGSFLYPELTALENLRFWSRLHGSPSDEASLMELLRKVGLEKRADDRAGTFSRGMTQRLDLARLLGASPQLVFLDEPETGLDAASREQLLGYMLGLKSAGAAIVWVSHSSDTSFADAEYRIEKKRVIRIFTGAAC